MLPLQCSRNPRSPKSPRRPHIKWARLKAPHLRQVACRPPCCPPHLRLLTAVRAGKALRCPARTPPPPIAVAPFRRFRATTGSPPPGRAKEALSLRPPCRWHELGTPCFLYLRPRIRLSWAWRIASTSAKSDCGMLRQSWRRFAGTKNSPGRGAHYESGLPGWWSCSSWS